MNIFRLPIEFLNNKNYIDDNIKNNLQLVDQDFLDYYNINHNNKDFDIDISNNNKYLYNSILNPKNIFSKLSSNLYYKYYTTDKKFLKENQYFIKSIDNNDYEIFSNNDSLKIINLLNEIKNETGFIEKYQYLEIPFLKELNNNKSFLQILSIYNLSSPVFSLILPFIMLLFPFIILIINKQELTLNNYIYLLTITFKDHIFGKIISKFKDSSIGEKSGLLFWFILYLYQIYNNCYYCYKFFNNIKTIHEKLNKLKNYIIISTKNFDNLINNINNYDTFNEFKQDVILKNNSLKALLNDINCISDYKISINKLFELGDLMKIFYLLHNDNSIYELLNYSYYLNGYIENNLQISNLYNIKKINTCTFSNNNTFINKNYYASLINENCVKNDIDMSNNIIISGPNASGKTTILKSILFNILLSQQIGFGCYQDANISCYDKFFCYLNIPDTNDRDSLFQAEAKICKNIIDFIHENINHKCLCVFDELYSGTNPDEAINSAYTLLNYLSKNNCKYILTTHFYKLCKLLDNNNNNNNYCMKVNSNNNNIKFTYKIIPGISKIKGAFNILKNLNYPEEILNNIKKINKKIL